MRAHVWKEPSVENSSVRKNGESIIDVVFHRLALYAYITSHIHAPIWGVFLNAGKESRLLVWG